MVKNVLPSDIHRHNWVTFLLSRFFLGTRERQVSYKLYKYLRQVDDFIDESGADKNECLRYIHEQRTIAKDKYTNGTTKENTLLNQIIDHDRQNGRKFQECIDLMMDVFEFDAHRKYSSVSADELRTYSLNLARAYTQFLVYFIEPGYQQTKDDILLAHACHLAHMIRDHSIDSTLGYINIAREDLKTYKLEPGRYDNDRFSQWLKKEVARISAMIEQGKRTMYKNRILTLKLMGLLYCFRYEVILRQIKSAGFQLRNKYQTGFRDSIRLMYQCIATCLKHFFQYLGL